MKRSQVTANITRWEGKGALYIVAHAKFKKSRGRGKNPSEPYKGELNPRKALLLALTELRIYEPMCGEPIETCVVKMIGVAKLTNQEVRGVFNDVSITATPKSLAESLAVRWQEEMDRQAREYRNSAEYKNSEREYRECEERRQLMLDGALLSAPETITLRDEEGWKNLSELNKNCIGIMNYAERWARLMEGRMTNGGTLEECADEASHLADNEGMSGASYGYAVGVLAQCWIHGEQLRRWHNSQYQLRNESDEANDSGGVLNPAMLRIRM